MTCIQSCVSLGRLIMCWNHSISIAENEIDVLDKGGRSVDEVVKLY